MNAGNYHSNYQQKKKLINDWYHKYSDDIYKFIFFMTRDSQLAEDMLQETFLKAFTHLNSFNGDNEKAWLFRIARNAALDSVRKKKPLTNLLDNLPLLKSNDPSPEQVAEFSDLEATIYSVLSKMKRAHREVIILRKLKDFSTKDAALVLGWSEAKVKTTLTRALKFLRKQLEKEGVRDETV
ncbi:RNA polymerase sigma factor [Litchfieldia alkalitelluris]|nr:RNA polymerase sigma factor [Litchfieldia alkalitelluris]